MMGAVESPQRKVKVANVPSIDPPSPHRRKAPYADSVRELFRSSISFGSGRASNKSPTQQVPFSLYERPLPHKLRQRRSKDLPELPLPQNLLAESKLRAVKQNQKHSQITHTKPQLEKPKRYDPEAVRLYMQRQRRRRRAASEASVSAQQSCDYQNPDLEKELEMKPTAQLAPKDSLSRSQRARDYMKRKQLEAALEQKRQKKEVEDQKKRIAEQLQALNEFRRQERREHLLKLRQLKSSQRSIHQNQATEDIGDSGPIDEAESDCSQQSQLIEALQGAIKEANSVSANVSEFDRAVFANVLDAQVDAVSRALAYMERKGRVRDKGAVRSRLASVHGHLDQLVSRIEQYKRDLGSRSVASYSSDDTELCAQVTELANHTMQAVSVLQQSSPAVQDKDSRSPSLASHESLEKSFEFVSFDAVTTQGLKPSPNTFNRYESLFQDKIKGKGTVRKDAGAQSRPEQASRSAPSTKDAELDVGALTLHLMRLEQESRLIRQEVQAIRLQQAAKHALNNALSRGERDRPWSQRVYDKEGDSFTSNHLSSPNSPRLSDFESSASVRCETRDDCKVANVDKSTTPGPLFSVESAKSQAQEPVYVSLVERQDASGNEQVPLQIRLNCGPRKKSSDTVLSILKRKLLEFYRDKGSDYMVNKEDNLANGSLTASVVIDEGAVPLDSVKVSGTTIDRRSPNFPRGELPSTGLPPSSPPLTLDQLKATSSDPAVTAAIEEPDAGRVESERFVPISIPNLLDNTSALSRDSLSHSPEPVRLPLQNLEKFKAETAEVGQKLWQALETERKLDAGLLEADRIREAQNESQREFEAMGIQYACSRLQEELERELQAAQKFTRQLVLQRHPAANSVARVDDKASKAAPAIPAEEPLGRNFEEDFKKFTDDALKREVSAKKRLAALSLLEPLQSPQLTRPSEVQPVDPKSNGTDLQYSFTFSSEEPSVSDTAHQLPAGGDSVEASLAQDAINDDSCPDSKKLWMSQTNAGSEVCLSSEHLPDKVELAGASSLEQKATSWPSSPAASDSVEDLVANPNERSAGEDHDDSLLDGSLIEDSNVNPLSLAPVVDSFNSESYTSSTIEESPRLVALTDLQTSTTGKVDSAVGAGITVADGLNTDPWQDESFEEITELESDISERIIGLATPRSDGNLSPPAEPSISEYIAGKLDDILPKGEKIPVGTAEVFKAGETSLSREKDIKSKESEFFKSASKRNTDVGVEELGDETQQRDLKQDSYHSDFVDSLTNNLAALVESDISEKLRGEGGVSNKLGSSLEAVSESNSEEEIADETAFFSPNLDTKPDWDYSVNEDGDLDSTIENIVPLTEEVVPAALKALTSVKPTLKEMQPTETSYRRSSFVESVKDAAPAPLTNTEKAAVSVEKESLKAVESVSPRSPETEKEPAAYDSASVTTEEDSINEDERLTNDLNTLFSKVKGLKNSLGVQDDVVSDDADSDSLSLTPSESLDKLNSVLQRNDEESKRKLNDMVTKIHQLKQTAAATFDLPIFGDSTSQLKIEDNRGDTGDWDFNVDERNQEKENVPERKKSIPEEVSLAKTTTSWRESNAKGYYSWLELHVPAKDSFSLPPRLPSLSNLPANLTARERETWRIYISATEEACRQIFASHLNYSNYVRNPVSFPFAVKPPNLNGAQVCDACRKILIDDWASYSARYGENLDALLIRQVKFEEEVDYKRVQHTASFTIKKQLANWIWDSLITEVVNELDRI